MVRSKGGNVRGAGEARRSPLEPHEDELGLVELPVGAPKSGGPVHPALSAVGNCLVVFGQLASGLPDFLFIVLSSLG
ncbi:MAG: hypothetical protein AAB074_04585 [Planctomycetota bacterium]